MTGMNEEDTLQILLVEKFIEHESDKAETTSHREEEEDEQVTNSQDILQAMRTGVWPGDSGTASTTLEDQGF